MTADQTLLRRAKDLSWYHTLELGPVLTTYGMFDLRPYVGEYGLPARLNGMRALEIGTWDGFWAFELERRGATVVALDLGTWDGFWAFELERRGATVVALDLDDERELDWPPRRRPAAYAEKPRGAGFAVAREILGSSVERVVCNVYDALPGDLGQFDLVFCGSVLIHLRDQLLALERIAGLTAPGGRFVFAEEYDPWSGLVPFPVSRYRADRNASVVFWQPSVRTWKRLLWTAGFDRVEQVGKFKMRSNHNFWVRHVVLHGSKDSR